MAGSIRRRLDRRGNPWELRVFLGIDDLRHVKHVSRLFHGSQHDTHRELGRLVDVYFGTLIAPVRELPERMVESIIPTGPSPSFPPPRPGQPSGLASVCSEMWDATTTLIEVIAAWRDNSWQDLSPIPPTAMKASGAPTSPPDGAKSGDHSHRLIHRHASHLSDESLRVERFLRSMKDSGQSPSSVRQARAILNRACRLARRWSNNRLPNPVAETELPSWSIRERSRAVRAPSIDEVQALLVAPRSLGKPVEAFVRLMAATGARRAELCAMRWSAIDWEEATVVIDEAVVNDNGATVHSPKTASSVRRIGIGEAAKSMLARLRVYCEQAASQAGVCLETGGFVFSADPTGAVPAHPDRSSEVFARLRRLAAVASDVHLHSLRHFHATVLDPIIYERQKQARLGWSKATTARHYTDAIGEEDRRAAAFVGRILDGAAEGWD